MKPETKELITWLESQDNVEKVIEVKEYHNGYEVKIEMKNKLIENHFIYKMTDQIRPS